MTELLEEIPELRDRYAEETKWLSKENIWVLCSAVLYKHIEALLKAANPDDGQLRRVFAFVETLLGQQDLTVREIAQDTVCENICSDEVVLQKAQRYLGPAAKKYCAEYLGHKPKK